MSWYNIEVRSIDDTLSALNGLDYDFESDRMYVLNDRIAQDDGQIFAIELTEQIADPPIRKDYRQERQFVDNDSNTNSGFVVSIDGEVAAGVVLSVEAWRSAARIDDLLVSRKFRRHGLGTLLIKHATEWARSHHCWSISAETQNVNYPAVQFYLRNGFEIWNVNPHLYPPGEFHNEIAIILGKRVI